jgi:glucose/mannose-6-phosphate isomerase
MRDLIASLGGQVRGAAGLVLPDVPGDAREILVCGMGGSGIAGDYLARLADAHRARISVHKGYGLPAWAGTLRPLVLLSSYSGNTEETLSAAEEAAGEGLSAVVVSSGGSLAAFADERGWPCVRVEAGLQPRAAFGWLLGAAVRVADAAGVAPGLTADLTEGADVVDRIVADGGWSLAADLAEGLEHRIVAVYGATGLTAPVANRWKTQLNENAKTPAWWSVLPELDHNEIVGWSGPDHLGRAVGVVSLHDHEDADTLGRRFRLTRQVTEDDVAWIGAIHAQGNSPFARMLSLTLVGDMVSVALAGRYGVDPMQVAAIDDLKLKMREES